VTRLLVALLVGVMLSGCEANPLEVPTLNDSFKECIDGWQGALDELNLTTKALRSSNAGWERCLNRCPSPRTETTDGH
jgi:hypothetical protein